MRRQSQFKQHVAKWKSCKLCPLHETRSQVVLARGTVPCDVLFIGEAPGASEDVIGQPFVGPAGKLLDRMVADAGYYVCDYDMRPNRIAFTNLVCCIPLGSEGVKVVEPPSSQLKPAPSGSKTF